MVGLNRRIAKLVALGLPRLGQEDQRGGVRRLRRERQVEKDEGVRIPAEAEGRGIEHDPHHHIWPMMKRGVPKKRAKRSAAMPKRSLPKAPWWTMRWGVAGFTMLLSCASRGQRRCAGDAAHLTMQEV
jgi:hypothetical protein